MKSRLSSGIAPRSSLSRVDTSDGPRIGLAAGIAAAATDEHIVGYQRSPSDVIRLLVYGAMALLLLVLTRWAPATVTGFQRDLVGLVNNVNPTIERLITGAAQIVVAIVAIAVFVPAFVLRRYRLLGYILVGNIVSGTAFAVAIAWLGHANLTEVARQAGEVHITLGVLAPRGLGNVACSFIILAPFVSVRWRRTGTFLIIAFSIARLMLSRTLPDDIFLALAIGATMGCLTLLAFGRPERRPTDAAVETALRTSGLADTEVSDASTADRASPEYLAELTDGTSVAVRVVNPADRSADLLYRAYRLLRLKDVGDERPFASLRRGVEHEALVALQARDVGVRTPRLRAVASVGSESMLLAYDRIDASTPLAKIDPDCVDDDVLTDLWCQLDILRTHRIGHRALQGSNVLIDDDGKAWLRNFTYSEIAAPDSVLDADVSQLLTVLALTVGVDRAVTSAFTALGGDVLVRALPLLQPAALRSSTRSLLHEHRGLLDELRSAITARCGVEAPPEAQLERVSRRTILTFGSLALATYFLLPQFADLHAITREVGDANWWWFPAVLAMSGVTYVGATLAVSGAVPQRIPTAPTFITQMASSFAAVLAPAGIGGMALNTRFLQRSGVDNAVAVSSVGLSTVAGFTMHLSLLALFVLWAGQSTFRSISLPDPIVLLYGLAVVVAIAAIGLAIPAIRRQIAARVVPALKQSASGLARTFRRPLKLVMLFGGAALISLGYILALFFATLAFGGDLVFAKVGAVFLVGAAIATVAPTPGGLGALEAALIAGLVAAGMDNAVAVPAVFLYRLATFWIPIGPGWLAFRWLQRADYV